MKIIAGKFKGKNIPFDDRLPSKPTKNIAKEAIFNYLNSEYHWQEITFLDLFAGTGNMGLEALSRGAKWVYFVDNSKHCQRFIQNIIRNWNVPNANFYLKDYQDFIKKNLLLFDIIFLDPPYQKIPLHTLVPRLLQFLNPNGTVILEHLSSDSFNNLTGFLEKKIYGSSAFSIFKKA